MQHLNNVDWHATDRCNLNCVSCGHMCPLVNSLSVDRTVKQAEEDFNVLYKATDNGKYVNQLTITGGECTLNKNLPEFIELANNYFPDKIAIWTNAMNQKLITQELINAIKKYNVLVNTTNYDDVKMNEYITNILEPNNIRYTIYIKDFIGNGQKQFFNKFFTIDTIEDNQNYLYCESKFNCCQLKDKKLYVCQYLAFLPYLFNKFPDIETKLEYNKSNSYIDLTKVTDYAQIESYIQNYNEPICNHCVDKWNCIDFQNRIQYRLQPWKKSSRELSEWVCTNINEIIKNN